MVRYIKQRNRFSCAVIAIINARKWQGQKLSYCSCYKHYSKINDSWWDLWQEISNLGAEIDIHPTVKKIEKILNSEKSVLVYSKCRHDAHLYNIVKHTKKSFLCLNVCWNITSEWISKSEFMNYWNCGKKKCGKTEHVIWRVPKTT